MDLGDALAAISILLNVGLVGYALKPKVQKIADWRTEYDKLQTMYFSLQARVDRIEGELQAWADAVDEEEITTRQRIRKRVRELMKGVSDAISPTTATTS